MSRKRPFGEFGSPIWGGERRTPGREWPLPLPSKSEVDAVLNRPEPALRPEVCSRCGGPHEPVTRTKHRFGTPLWCPLLTDDETRIRAMEGVEWMLVRATGQTPGVEASMHRHIAEEILNYAGYYSWGTNPDPWGEPILAAYWGHEDLGPQIRCLQKAWRLLAEEEKTHPLSGHQANLIVGHEPLVQATATRLLRNPRGQINQFHFTALVDLGQSILIQQVRRYDPDRGITFGAFVQKRLNGAMADWLLENNHLYLDIDDDGGWTAEPAQKYVRDTTRDAEPIRRRGRPRGSRGKSGAKSVVRKKSGATKGVESLDRNLEVLSQYTTVEIETALEAIRQRPKVGLSAERVFRGRFLTKPEVTLSVLGQELGLDRAGVSRKAQNTFNVVVAKIEAARKGKQQHPVINSGIYR